MRMGRGNGDAEDEEGGEIVVGKKGFILGQTWGVRIQIAKCRG